MLFFSLTSRHKKTWDFLSYQFHEVLDYLTYQIRKAHDVTRERFLLIFWYVFMKLSRFHETKYKQKRFYMS